MRTPPFISPVRSAGSVLVVFLALFIIAVPAGAGAIWLDSLDAAKAQADGSVSATNCVRCGQPVTLGGEARARAISVSGTTRWFISLPGTGGTFTAIAGFDDCTPTNTGAQAVFSIIAPGTSVWTSGALRPQDAPRRIEAALGGLPVIGIVIECRGRRATAVLADAKIDAPGARIVPASDAAVQGDMGILTPPERPEPRINAPRVFGVRPGAPVLFTVPVSGERPMKITAERLPAGLVLDPTTGRLSGSLTNAGRFVVKIIAENAAGKCHGDLAIVASNVIALTPPLGWNSWNCWARAVDDAKVRAAADAFVKAGLINYGWSYINIDDCWEAGRDSNGFITANEKFPDMKALCGYVHDKGLKIGLYSSPGPKTCAGFEGSYQHELQDAQQWAAWGFDYLKYDWCSYDRVAGSNGLERLRKPYRLMRAALDTVRRDIVYSLCQYGMGNVSAWGADVGGNCWRTTGDITDTWGSMAGIGFAQGALSEYAGPGRWNDPDMLVVGHVGWGAKTRPCRLTRNEQYTHISLWCLLASPLLLGCDLGTLDEFTRSLLTNHEVLDVNQDELGRQATRVWRSGHIEAWAKAMADGSLAVGVFNLDHFGARGVVVPLEPLGCKGRQRARDLWRQKSLGTLSGKLVTDVPGHGVVLLKLSAAPSGTASAE